MQIDYALILSAGFGTRMGEIGKVIPKVLWPIYFKNILELQIKYCEDLGVKNIYLNTHFLHDEIVSFLKRSGLFKKVIILHEEVLLDSGGAIHNLAIRPEVNYKGNLLLVNGDQFLFFDNKYWIESKNRIKNCRAVLFGIKADKTASYNETIIKDQRLIQIEKRINQDRDYVTYSGLGLLNLNNLRPVPGISRFFETVADYKNEKVDFITPEIFEYWDFGTAVIYMKNIFKLKSLDEEKSLMNRFLVKNDVFFGNEELFINKRNYSLDLDYLGRFKENTIQAKNISQKV